MPVSPSQDPRIDPGLVAERDLERLPPGLFSGVSPRWFKSPALDVAALSSDLARARAGRTTSLCGIQPGSRVLDLGCGDGQLLERLQREQQVSGQGVEIAAAAVLAATMRGVSVFQADLSEGLSWFPDNSFDVVVLEETLQTLAKPRLMLGEMLRVGRRGIVSFPNFAHWRVIVDLVAHGRMPVTERLPYHWYDSDNIHPFTLQDLLDWISASSVRIVAGHSFSDGAVRHLRPEDNLHAEEVLVVLERT